jgi:hypothetical protein
MFNPLDERTTIDDLRIEPIELSDDELMDVVGGQSGGIGTHVGTRTTTYFCTHGRTFSGSTSVGTDHSEDSSPD